MADLPSGPLSITDGPTTTGGTIDDPPQALMSVDVAPGKVFPFHSLVVRVEDVGGTVVWEDEELYGELLPDKGIEFFKQLPLLEDGAYRLEMFVFAGEEFGVSRRADLTIRGGIAHDAARGDTSADVTFDEWPHVEDGMILYSVANIGAVAATDVPEFVRLQHRPSGWSWTNESTFETLAPYAQEQRRVAIPDEAPDGHIEGFVTVNLNTHGRFDFDKGEVAATDTEDAGASEPWDGKIDLGFMELDLSSVVGSSDDEAATEAAAEPAAETAAEPAADATTEAEADPWA